LPHELLINNESKSKTSFINTNTPKASRKLEIESDETVDVEKSKNFKMLMKVKDENFLEKLIVKKLEEEKSPSTNKIERLQSIELGVRGSQFISSLLTMRNSEISQSNKVSEIDSNLYSQSSSSFVSKLESSTSSGHQQGSSREQQSEQIQIKRQEQFQQMAQRLGETLAKRIIEQISRGAWRVQIALKPASLGNIEISLNLRGKEIEASFHAPQALTRELLAESLPKLKDSLEKAGMNVAEMNVTGQNESKSDKNSTNKENKDKEIKINEIKIDSKDDEKTKESISNADHSGGLNILV
jgi:flagellar hook-length control protein FliK